MCCSDRLNPQPKGELAADQIPIAVIGNNRPVHRHRRLGFLNSGAVVELLTVTVGMAANILTTMKQPEDTG